MHNVGQCDCPNGWIIAQEIASRRSNLPEPLLVFLNLKWARIEKIKAFEGYAMNNLLFYLNSGGMKIDKEPLPRYWQILPGPNNTVLVWLDPYQSATIGLGLAFRRPNAGAIS
jgi:hypothetical protein